MHRTGTERAGHKSKASLQRRNLTSMTALMTTFLKTSPASPTQVAFTRHALRIQRNTLTKEYQVCMGEGMQVD